jgi:hypothetical protein
MRFIAIVLNIALFLLGMQQLVLGYPWNSEALTLMILTVACPMVNMYILTHVQEEVSWLARFLKRRTLQEEERILEEKEHILEEKELILEEQEKIELEKQKLQELRS